MRGKEAVLIKYGELFLKSEPVMRHYVRVLTGNFKQALEGAGLDHAVHVYRGRVLVTGTDLEEIAIVARRIFGIVGVSICTWTEADLAVIEETAVARAREHLFPGMTFAVRARRSGTEGFSSQELGAKIGGMIFGEIPGLSVDLTDPDYELFVEARDIGGIVYDRVAPGPGGVPLGTQARSLSLLSSGIDSPVASWLMMRRGSIPTFLHCRGGEWAGADVAKTALAHATVLSGWAPGIWLPLIEADFAPFYSELVRTARTKNRCIICKRMMLRTALAVATAERLAAIVTGENLGQVASQTMENLGVIGAVIPPNMPLLRPLLTYDKQETIDLARRIGTFRESAGDLSCRAVPKHPAIAASLEAVQEDEEKMDVEALLEEILASLRRSRIRDGVREEP